MGNPTGVHSWWFPVENQDPWHTAYDAWIDQVDQALWRLQCYGGIGWKCVWSSAPNAGYLISGGFDYLPLSYGPAGVAVGSFVVPTTGLHAMVRLELRGSIGSIAAINPSDAIFGLDQRVRVVITPGSIVCGGSRWYHNHSFPGRMVLTRTDAVSLAPGTYRAEVQMAQSAHASASYSSFNILSGELSTLAVMMVVPMSGARYA